MNFLVITDEPVQEFLWTYLVPRQLHVATKGEAFRFVWDEVMAGRQWLVGDLDRGILFRLNLCNPVVLELHVMGDVTQLEPVMAEGMALVWRKDWGGAGAIQRVVISSTRRGMTKFLPPIGWVYEGESKRRFWDGKTLQPLYFFYLENPNAAQA